MNWGVFTGLGVGLIMAIIWKDHQTAIRAVGIVAVAVGVLGEIFS